MEEIPEFTSGRDIRVALDMLSQEWECLGLRRTIPNALVSIVPQSASSKRHTPNSTLRTLNLCARALRKWLNVMLEEQEPHRTRSATATRADLIPCFFGPLPRFFVFLWTSLMGTDITKKVPDIPGSLRVSGALIRESPPPSASVTLARLTVDHRLVVFAWGRRVA
jgi:hypothetical protein